VFLTNARQSNPLPSVFNKRTVKQAFAQWRRTEKIWGRANFKK
jgi:hypothetical protein